MREGKIIIKKDHSNCNVARTKSEAYLLREPYHGNSLGNINKKRTNWHHWYPIICNDPRCSFSALVEWIKLSEFIQIELKNKLPSNYE